MRFIDLEALDPSSQGLQEVLENLLDAQAKVVAESDPERRRALIKLYSPRWSAMREYLAQLSYGKCWYTECRDSGADRDVDHFRPKSRVAGVPSHPGYYWLAFNPENLRFSCQLANRPRRNEILDETGGKADHFPLLNPEMRARSPMDDIKAELPELLDPINPDDTALISFIQSGEARLSPFYSGNSVAERRFEATRQYLNLNWPKFTEDRQVLYNKIVRLVERGRKADPQRNSDSSRRDSFRDAIRDLKNLMKPDSEYSVAAGDYIRLFRHEWWIEQIVLRLS